MPCSHGPSCREAELVASTGWRRRRTALSRLYLDKVYRGSICLRLVLPSSFYTPLGDEGRPKFAQCLVPRPPHDAHRSRVGRRAPTPTITTDRRLARPCGEQKFGSLRACRMLCDVWTLARNARKLAFHPWARGRTAVVGSLCDAPIGSSTSSPATSQHGSSLDGSLLSMLLAFCTASPGSLRRPAGPARTASGAMALLSTYLFDACRLSNLVAGGRPAWRAARWQPAQYALDSDFCLAALTAAASGAGASRLASPVLSTPATRVSARRPRRPRRARMARRSSGAFPAGCAGQSASLRAPPPLRGAATGAAAVNTAAVYVTIASLRRRSRRRRSPLAAALPCPAQPSHKQTNTHADSLILVPLSRAGGA